MTSASPDSIISGRVYPITQVGGRRPTKMGDFVGATEFLIEEDAITHHICGVGTNASDEVCFYEKDPQHEGRDVRKWRIRSIDQASFCAQHIAAI